MDNLGIKLRELRLKSNKTQQEVANILCINRVTYTQYESNKRSPQPDMLKKIADLFNVSLDELLGRTIANSTTQDKLSQRDEQQIADDLEKMLADLDNQNSMAAMGGTVEDEEDRELLKASLLTSMRLAKKLAKKKYTPKKYRKDED